MEAPVTGESTREVNMSKRRALILSHARLIIAREGYDALKLRDLANKAGVTVPTIYNLIGGKPDILNAIMEDLVERLLEVQQRVEGVAIESAFAEQINRLAKLFASDEDSYRAAFVAGDRTGLFEQQSASGFFARSVRLPIEACQEAQSHGLLHGGIAPELLGRQIYGAYRLARQDWVNGYFDLETFRTQALTGVYLCLAADATPKFHRHLMQEIVRLNK